MTSSLSLFALAELLTDATKLGKVRLLMPADDTKLAILGSDGDRGACNKLQMRWLAKRFARCLHHCVELRCADGGVPQGALVLRDLTGEPQQAVLGSFSISTEGLGITPGNPLSLIQA